ncbi:LysR family transcriptional regulator [Pseudonocardia sp. CA-107938]|uniref:LysR family transcriptional regulator n=1 Tax=Pseudonocardia sp. CA-107938 TaxID=3240021 RepID=UPI003D924C39
MSLAQLDLNLLVPLDMLLQERSVTRAATRLGLSQPALSAALARLRRHFDDPLLVRVGNAYELSPLAVALRRRVADALDSAERVFTSEAGFDPSVSQRTFTLLMSDYPMAVLGPLVLAMLRKRAPRTTLRLERHSTANVEGGVEGLRTVDGLVLPHGFVFDAPSVDLYSDSWVCLVDAHDSPVGSAMTLADAARLPWVFTYNGPTAFTAAGRQLQLIGVAPRVEVVVESFLALPFYIAGSDRVGLVQQLLAEPLTRDGRLRAVPCAWDVVPVLEALWWHPMHTPDPEHVWLRGVLTEAAAGITGSPL